MPKKSTIAKNVRKLSGVSQGKGPTDAQIEAAVRGFAKVFDYWYIRVMKEAVKKYRTLLVQRINPFIRRIEYDGVDCETFGNRLVEDYNARNFVTAGGWAIEALALNINPGVQKSAAQGIDIQRYDPETREYHLYVLKSGLVTRNSDIVAALKKNSRSAEKLLRQSGNKGQITLNYAIAAGKTTSTHEDGVRRPSSADFWAEMTALPGDEAVDLVLCIAAEAGRIVRRDASDHVAAMKTLLKAYLAEPTDSNAVDWKFLRNRNFNAKSTWAKEDAERHKRALKALKKSGYKLVDAVESEGQKEDSTPVDKLEKFDAPPGTSV